MLYIREMGYFPSRESICGAFELSLFCVARHIKKMRELKLIIPTGELRNAYKINYAQLTRTPVTTTHRVQINKARNSKNIETVNQIREL